MNARVAFDEKFDLRYAVEAWLELLADLGAATVARDVPNNAEGAQ